MIVIINKTLSLYAYTSTHPVCPQEYQTSQQRRQLVLLKVHEGKGHHQKITVQQLVEQLVLCDKQHKHRIRFVAVTNYMYCTEFTVTDVCSVKKSKLLQYNKHSSCELTDCYIKTYMLYTGVHDIHTYNHISGSCLPPIMQATINNIKVVQRQA